MLSGDERSHIHTFGDIKNMYSVLTSTENMPWALASSVLVTGPGPGLVNLLPLFQDTGLRSPMPCFRWCMLTGLGVMMSRVSGP